MKAQRRIPFKRMLKNVRRRCIFDDVFASSPRHGGRPKAPPVLRELK